MSLTLALHVVAENRNSRESPGHALSTHILSMIRAGIPIHFQLTAVRRADGKGILLDACINIDSRNVGLKAARVGSKIFTHT